MIETQFPIELCDSEPARKALANHLTLFLPIAAGEAVEVRRSYGVKGGAAMCTVRLTLLGWVEQGTYVECDPKAMAYAFAHGYTCGAADTLADEIRRRPMAILGRLRTVEN